MDILKKDWNVKKTKNNRGKDILDDDYDSSRSVPLGGGQKWTNPSSSFFFPFRLDSKDETIDIGNYGVAEPCIEKWRDCSSVQLSWREVYLFIPVMSLCTCWYLFWEAIKQDG